MRSEPQTSAAVLPRRVLGRWLGKGSVLRRMTRRRVNAVALVVLVVIIFAAAAAPVISKHDPVTTNAYNIHQGPSFDHFLGTDDLGRDTFSRLVHATRISVQVAFVAVGIAIAAGTPLGLLAGFRGGTVDEVIMRVMDGIIVLPTLILALAIASALGPSLQTVMIAIGFTNIPRYARLVRGQVLTVREADYVMAARATGTPALRIAMSHILPNSLQPIIVQATISSGFAIFQETSLSFLGVGIQPPTASWGSMLQSGYQFLETNLLESFVPGIAIFVTVLAVNLIGDGLREALDPRLRGT